MTGLLLLRFPPSFVLAFVLRSGFRFFSYGFVWPLFSQPSVFPLLCLSPVCVSFYFSFAYFFGRCVRRFVYPFRSFGPPCFSSCFTSFLPASFGSFLCGVTLSCLAGFGARARLPSFVAAHGACLCSFPSLFFLRFSAPIPLSPPSAFFLVYPPFRGSFFPQFSRRLLFLFLIFLPSFFLLVFSVSLGPVSAFAPFCGCLLAGLGLPFHRRVLSRLRVPSFLRPCSLGLLRTSVALPRRPVCLVDLPAPLPARPLYPFSPLGCVLCSDPLLVTLAPCCLSRALCRLLVCFTLFPVALYFPFSLGPVSRVPLFTPLLFLSRSERCRLTLFCRWWPMGYGVVPLPVRFIRPCVDRLLAFPRLFFTRLALNVFPSFSPPCSLLSRCLWACPLYLLLLYFAVGSPPPPVLVLPHFTFCSASVVFLRSLCLHPFSLWFFGPPSCLLCASLLVPCLSPSVVSWPRLAPLVCLWTYPFSVRLWSGGCVCFPASLGFF